MDTSYFWRLIEQSKTESGGNCTKQVDALTAILLELAAEEIEEFDIVFYRFHAQAYRNDVWAAAYIMNGGCSTTALSTSAAGSSARARRTTPPRFVIQRASSRWSSLDLNAHVLVSPCMDTNANSSRMRQTRHTSRKQDTGCLRGPAPCQN
jgi:hypothetical protein